jgi:hypothetical protein
MFRNGLEDGVGHHLNVLPIRKSTVHEELEISNRGVVLASTNVRSRILRSPTFSL